MLEFKKHPDQYKIQNSVRRNAKVKGLLAGAMKTTWSTTIAGKSTARMLKEQFGGKVIISKKPFTNVRYIHYMGVYGCMRIYGFKWG